MPATRKRRKGTKAEDDSAPEESAAPPSAVLPAPGAGEPAAVGSPDVIRPPDKPTSAPPPSESKPAPALIATGPASKETAKQTPPSSEPVIDKGILYHEAFVSEYYNQTYCYALPKNSRAIFVFWEIGEGTRNHLKQRFGQHFFNNNYLVLRVRRTDNNIFFDIEDYLDNKNSYWVDVDANSEYEVELGYRAKGTKYFERVAGFKGVRTQPDAENKHESQNEWREVKVPGFGKELKTSQNDWRFNYYELWKYGRVTNKPPERGYWALVLHMHLPFVRHPEYPVALEEQWLFEAITSCYAPLLNIFWALERDKIDFRITVSISPPLVTMLSDPFLQSRYREFLKESIGLAERELNAHRGRAYQHTIETILERLHTARKVFEAYGGNILKGFKDFQDLGKCEIMTCPGTHPILPYYMHYPEMIRGHIQLACRQYEKHFGRWPRGMWLPENAFTPGLDHFLVKEGIKWTLMNSTGLTRGNTRVWYDTKRPVITHNGLAVFGIDEDTRAQVWSREAGYPGDARYKEWYRDVGYDMNWDHLPNYWKVGNVRRNTGIKYYRITGKNVQLHEKQPYNPEWARQAVNEQSGQFVCHRGAQAIHWSNKYQVKPMAVSAYDAELFGHWWEEGPSWIEMVFRKMLYDQDQVRPCTPSEFLCENPKHQLLMPGMSTWGKKATYETWLDGRAYQPNAWIYRHLFRATENLVRLATEKVKADGLEKRAINQAARELMLAQSSDWSFLISMGQCARYAEVRMVKHIDRCKELIRQVDQKCINTNYLQTLENADTLLSFDMDYRVFCKG